MDIFPSNLRFLCRARSPLSNAYIEMYLWMITDSENFNCFNISIVFSHQCIERSIQSWNRFQKLVRHWNFSLGKLLVREIRNGIQIPIGWVELPIKWKWICKMLGNEFEGMLVNWWKYLQRQKRRRWDVGWSENDPDRTENICGSELFVRWGTNRHSAEWCRVKEWWDCSWRKEMNEISWNSSEYYQIRF